MKQYIAILTLVIASGTAFAASEPALVARQLMSNASVTELPKIQPASAAVSQKADQRVVRKFLGWLPELGNGDGCYALCKQTSDCEGYFADPKETHNGYACYGFRFSQRASSVNVYKAAYRTADVTLAPEKQEPVRVTRKFLGWLPELGNGDGCYALCRQTSGCGHYLADPKETHNGYACYGFIFAW